METEKNSQLELFSQSGSPLEIKKHASGSFLRRIWSYEKIILIIMGFLLTSILSFSFGVEKGKKLSILRNSSKLDFAQTPPAPNPIENKKTTEYKILSSQNLNGYVIQVASYITTDNAQKEVELLKKRGFVARVINKGRYNIVCIGEFSSKDMAVAILPRVKKQYQDCFIRRL